MDNNHRDNTPHPSSLSTKEFIEAHSCMILMLERVDLANSFTPPLSGSVLNHAHTLKHYCALKLQELVTKEKE